MRWPFTRKKKTSAPRFDELPPFWQGYMTEMSELNEGTIAHLTVENEALRARLETVEAAVESVARWAWRTDPPNATGHLTDTDRLSCIKHHPTIKKAAQPHIELAEAESARALSQEGSEPS